MNHRMKITNKTIEAQLAELVPKRGHIIVKILNVGKNEFIKFEKVIDKIGFSFNVNQKIKLLQFWVLETLARLGDAQSGKMFQYSFSQELQKIFFKDLKKEKNYNKHELLYGLILQEKDNRVRIGVFGSLSKMEDVLK